MSGPALLLVLVSLFLGGEDDATPPAPGNPAGSDLRERARGLLPDVERVLGAELGKPLEFVVSAETSGKVFRAELAQRLSAIQDGPRGESLAHICEKAIVSPAGFVDRHGRIHAVWATWGEQTPRRSTFS